MILRLPKTVETALRTRAALCGMDPSEVARRAIRRNARCYAQAETLRVTRNESTLVRLDVDAVALGLKPSDVRSILAGQLAATEPPRALPLHLESESYAVVEVEE